jgi:hypothetical protein
MILCHFYLLSCIILGVRSFERYVQIAGRYASLEILQSFEKTCFAGAAIAKDGASL